MYEESQNYQGYGDRDSPDKIDLEEVQGIQYQLFSYIYPCSSSKNVLDSHGKEWTDPFHGVDVGNE